jgi:hypothetical protein
MQGIIVGLVHVSDRFYRAPSVLYDAASFVIRVGHWHGNVAAKVLTVPIGPAGCRHGDFQRHRSIRR